MMNIKDYIESGILTEYCLGLLNNSQEQRVEADCRQYPELKMEMERILYSLERYGLSQSVHPTDGLKEKIWQNISNINLEENGDKDRLPLLNKYSD